MKILNRLLILFVTAAVCQAAMAQVKKHPRFKTGVPRDSIRLSDPCVLPDEATRTYYMTGTGGLLWKSKDLDTWDGPYIVANTDPNSWLGPRPNIWAAELNKYGENF